MIAESLLAQFPMQKIGTKIATTEISISVVSHGQIGLIENLLCDINAQCVSEPIELILTLNLDETVSFDLNSFSFPIRVIRNAKPRGFGANHNFALMHARGRFLCAINPDIRFDKDPFPPLLTCLEDPRIGVAAPLVVRESGEIEDSARRFPTPLKILCKVFGKCRDIDYPVTNEPAFPDWVAGMFMLFPSKVFAELGGFDEHYFLYYEDVDLCARLRLSGHEVALCPDARVVHHARRSSHRKIKYMKWHIGGMLRFFLSPAFARICWRRLTRQSAGSSNRV